MGLLAVDRGAPSRRAALSPHARRYRRGSTRHAADGGAARPLGSPPVEEPADAMRARPHRPSRRRADAERPDGDPRGRSAAAARSAQAKGRRTVESGRTRRPGRSRHERSRSSPARRGPAPSVRSRTRGQHDATRSSTSRLKSSQVEAMFWKTFPTSSRPLTGNKSGARGYAFQTIFSSSTPMTAGMYPAEGLVHGAQQFSVLVWHRSHLPHSSRRVPKNRGDGDVPASSRELVARALQTDQLGAGDSAGHRFAMRVGKQRVLECRG